MQVYAYVHTEPRSASECLDLIHTGRSTKRNVMPRLPKSTFIKGCKSASDMCLDDMIYLYIYICIYIHIYVYIWFCFLHIHMHSYIVPVTDFSLSSLDGLGVGSSLSLLFPLGTRQKPRAP